MIYLIWDIELSTPNEIKNICKLIIEVEDMLPSERDCIRASYKYGPISDHDIQSPSDCNLLLDKGFMAKVIVNGVYGYNACTYKGAMAYKIFDADTIAKIDDIYKEIKNISKNNV